MKLSFTALLLYITVLASSASIPHSNEQFSERDIVASAEYLDSRDFSALEKRKGGGGKGGGSSGGSSSSSGSGRSGTSSSGSSGSYSYSSSSNVGGRTRSGSGSPPAYGSYYNGGAKVPYTSGSPSTSGIAPFLLPAAALTVFPGIWLYSSLYAYPYHTPYYYNDNGRNQTVNVTCVCQEYSVCGCDDDGNSTFVTQLVTNNGTAGDLPVNSTTVRTVTYSNGTQEAFVNGTLDNGTTASGGTDPSNDSQASGVGKVVVEFAGYWIMAASVGAIVLMS